MSDVRMIAPAAARNRDAILAVLQAHLPARGTVLEVASGTGEHVAHFAAALPDLVFQPSDPDAARRPSIDAWTASSTNVLAAIDLDASAANWPVGRADAVLCINMIHIAPWDATLGLIAGAARVLGQGGVLFLYGPYRRGGTHTAPSNAEFDASLRGRNAAWGIRDMEDVAALALASGFSAPVIAAMPANNFSLIFKRVG